MIAEWKDPAVEMPKIKGDSVCVMVTPGSGGFQYPAKAWYNGDGNFWLAASGDIAVVDGWDYYPEHLEK